MSNEITMEDLIAAKEAMDAAAVSVPVMMFTEQGMFYRDEKTGEWWNEDRTEKLRFGMEEADYEINVSSSVAGKRVASRWL